LESNIGSKGFNEFMFSAAVGDIRRMGELIAYGAEVNLQDDAGATAIMYAIDKGQVEAVKFLLSNGADLTLKTNQGRDCMELVKLSNNDALLSLFPK
jgi:ankyrin repeat protein